MDVYGLVTILKIPIVCCLIGTFGIQLNKTKHSLHIHQTTYLNPWHALPMTKMLVLDNAIRQNIQYIYGIKERNLTFNNF